MKSRRYSKVLPKVRDFSSHHEKLEKSQARVQLQQAVAPVQRVVKEVFRERETVREIVKVRSHHCRTLFEEDLNRCPNCGAPA